MQRTFDSDERFYEVTSKEVASILLDEREAEIISVFLKEPISLSKAAEKTGIKLNTLHYKVKRYCELNILKLCGHQKQNGRNVKLYRAVSQHFMIPFALSDSETLEDLVAKIIMLPLDDVISGLVATRLTQNPEWSVLLKSYKGKNYLTKTIAPRVEHLSDFEAYVKDVFDNPVSPAAQITWGSLELGFEDAKAMQMEIQELYKKYKAKSKIGQQRYVYLNGFAPETSET